MTRLLTYIIWILQIITGGLFIFSGLVKLYPIEPFEYQLVESGIFSWTLSPVLSRIIIGAEILAGSFLIAGLAIRRFTMPLLFTLLAVFTTYLIYQLITIGNQADCGCFGSMLPFSTNESIIKNFILSGCCIIIYKKHYSWKFRFRKVAIITLFIISMGSPFVLNMLSYTRYSEKPQDKTRLPAELPVMIENGEPVNLYSGRKVIGFFSTECGHCRHAAYKLGVMRTQKEIEQLYIYFMGNEDQIPEFFQEAHYTFPYTIWNDKAFLEVTEATFPTVLVVQDGVILRTLHSSKLIPENLK